MSIPTNNSKFVSMLLVLISMFILIFFTKSYYSNLIASMDTNADNKKNHALQLKEIEELEKKRKELKNIDNNKIGKYLHTYNEDEIIKEIYNFASIKTKNGQVLIKSLSMSEGKINELGFNEAKINISARVDSKKAMIDFLDFLIKDSKYKFYINSFTVPKTSEKAFYIQVPLTLFYKGIKQIPQN